MLTLNTTSTLLTLMFVLTTLRALVMMIGEVAFVFLKGAHGEEICHLGLLTSSWLS